MHSNAVNMEKLAVKNIWTDNETPITLSKQDTYALFCMANDKPLKLK